MTLGKRQRRAVVDIEVGSGTDVLTLECGHEVVVNHRAKPRKIAECLSCPRVSEAQ